MTADLSSRTRRPPGKLSAGLLMYRRRNDGLQVFLVHPGGPFFAKKDQGVWSIPKGEPNPGEELLQAALREFEEETGVKPEGKLLSLGTITQPGGKIVHAWAFQGNHDDHMPLRSNTFRIEWPPHSGTFRDFPEVDRAKFFEVDTARHMMHPAQVPLLERLVSLLTDTHTGPAG